MKRPAPHRSALHPPLTMSLASTLSATYSLTASHEWDPITALRWVHRLIRGYLNVRTSARTRRKILAALLHISENATTHARGAA